jgi:hypothetical protein
LLTTQRRSVTQDLRPKRAPMAIPRAVKVAKAGHATVMAVTGARGATVRNVETCRSVLSAVTATSARTVHRLTTSSRWRVLPLIPEDQMRLQPL